MQRLNAIDRSRVVILGCYSVVTGGSGPIMFVWHSPSVRGVRVSPTVSTVIIIH